MSYKRYAFLAIITMAGLGACAAKTKTVYSEPQAFDGAAYCETVDRQVELVIPADITAVLEDDAGLKDEGEIAEALLTKAAMEIAHASETPEECKMQFTKGETLFKTTLAQHQKSLSKKGKHKKAKDKSLRPTQDEITRMWREDQSARRTYIGLRTKDKTGADFWAQRRATAHVTRIDAASRNYIAGLLKIYDWIDISRFGKKVSKHAWILVQHADDHPEFQEEVLSRMEPYLETGGVSKIDYAYLWDRVAVNTGRLQRYGTQPTWECSDDNQLTLKPLEDPENVNARRAEIGLDTVEEGLATMAREVCR